MEQKVAIITGVNGQDGSYLSEILLEKNYIVHGIIRRSSMFNKSRITHLENNPNFFLHYGDVTDSLSLSSLISTIKPDEFYNLAAQSHVRISFEIPQYTSMVDAIGTLNVLETLRLNSPKTKLYQASTSELYGKVVEIPQSEITPFYPRSPYGVAKLYGYWIVKNYRESYNIFACNGILFNHTSPRRGENFVEKKIVDNIVDLHYGKRNSFSLGNLDAKRDMGHAKEYCEGMWRMLQQQTPDDYVLATGKYYSVRNILEICSSILGYSVSWSGEGVAEVGSLSSKEKEIKNCIQIDPKFFRPAEVDELLGNPLKAKTLLGWEAKIGLEEILLEMIEDSKKRYEL